MHEGSPNLKPFLLLTQWAIRPLIPRRSVQISSRQKVRDVRPEIFIGHLRSQEIDFICFRTLTLIR
jgi:hypothetical protein